MKLSRIIRGLRIALAACVLGGAAFGAFADAGALHARYSQLRDALAHNPYQRPIHIDSAANGILTLMTGTPMLFTGGSALNTPGNTQTADQIAPVQILHGVGAGNPWFSPSSFAQETRVGVFGNTGRNILSGPGFFNLDASLFKLINFTERYSLEIRGEAFGITNTPQFSNPNTTVGNSNFGIITGASGGRVLQLGMKLNF